MGKYPASLIHDKYSEWHYNHLMAINYEKYKYLGLADIDNLIYKPEVEGYRLWIEHDFKKPLAAMDLKWEGGIDSITKGEVIIYNWLEDKKLPCYIVFITFDFLEFRIKRWITSVERKLNEIEYADWLLSLRYYNYSGL